MSVCPLAYLENHVSDLHPIFWRTVPVAVSRSSSDDVAMHCALPVLWVMTYFFTVGPIARTERAVVVRRSSPIGSISWTSDNHTVFGRVHRNAAPGDGGEVCHLQ